MKIEKLKLKNFAQFEDFEIVFNDGVTHLIGINGSGKTTVGLTALWAGFRGIAEKSKTGALIGERYRFISDGKKSLDIEITLKDEVAGKTIKLRRHITKGTNTIKITPDDGDGLSREYVENLFNVSFLSATHFSALSGVQQAEAMGIDTSVYDSKLILRKDEAKDFRREIKAIGDLTPVIKVDPVNIVDLQTERAEAVEFNNLQHDLEADTGSLKRDIAQYVNKIKEVQTKLDAARIKYAALNTVQAPKDIESIDTRIREVTKINGDAFKYDQYKESLGKLHGQEDGLNENLIIQDTIVTERFEYLQSKTFGIKGLAIDEKGQLTKDDKLIRSPYFSKGELEVLVARIAMNLNPELKVRFIDDFELLDDGNQEVLIKNLTKKGFQIITAKVGNQITGDNSVLLRACQHDIKVQPSSGVEPGAHGLDDIHKNEDEDPRQKKFADNKGPSTDLDADDFY